MKQLNKKSLLFVLVLLVLAFAVNNLVFAADVTVGTGTPASCTEAAFETALTTAADGDTIIFDCGGGAVTIPVTEAAPTDLSGIPAISKNLTIDGAGLITFDGGYNGVGGSGTRLFQITQGVTVTFSGVVFAHADATNAELAQDGAAIYTAGNLNIVGSTFRNSRGGRGSAIAAEKAALPSNVPVVNIFQSAFVDNISTARSVFYIASSELNVANSTFSGNISNSAPGSIVRSTSAAGTVLNFTNVTISTPTGDAAVFSLNHTVNLRNSIISTASGTEVCDAGAAAGITDGGGNVVFGGGTCTGLTPASTGDPQLGALSSSFVPYYDLGAGSSALNQVVTDAYLSTAGNPLFANGAAVAVDQNNVVRPQGTAKDAGAIESALEPEIPTPESPTPETPTPETPTPETPIPLPGAFNLISPADDVVIRDTSEVTAITWGLSAGAESYEFVLIKTSDNVRLGEVLRVDVLAENCGATPGVCTLSVGADVQALLTDGVYSWTVNAENSFGVTEASNAPFDFTVSTEGVELVINGGFENLDTDGKPVIDPWVVKKETGDKVKCNKPEKAKIFSYTGECAWRFKGQPGDKTKLVQNIDPTLATTGDLMILSAAVDANVTPGKLIFLKVEYADPTAGVNGDGRDKAVIEITGPTLNEEYEVFSVNLTVADVPTEIKVLLKGKAESGKIYVDDVSVLSQPTLGGGAAPLPLPLP
jgi:hypothetical protein